MKKIARRMVASGAGLALALGGVVAASPAQAAPAPRPDQQVRKDNFSSPQADKQRELKLKAMELVANGKAEKKPAKGGGSVVKVKGKAVEFFDNEKQANVWTILSEFGAGTCAGLNDAAGPLHNQLPQPDRTQDNSTQWTPDFNLAHYDEIFNTGAESFKAYYVAQSSGQYTPSVTVEDWVQVPNNASCYGANDPETGDDSDPWAFINDTVDAWYQAQKAAGKSDAEIATYLKQFDQWDRYDYDGDANFNEPDGYIDHFQAIHAGAGEEAGADADAIWSHRWYADPMTAGEVGPEGNLQGGQQIGNTGLYVGDYTVEPENGGTGVFAHEYGHDLGLPDFYDTRGGDNGSAYWTLMSSGSWLGHGDNAAPGTFEEGIGGVPNDMGPEEKLALGWLKPTVVKGGTNAHVTLPAAGQPSNNAAVQVLLPDATTVTELTTPKTGSHSWYSGSQSNLTAALTRDVPAASEVSVSADVWLNTEADYDFFSVQYSTDGGTSWTSLGDYSGEADWANMSWSYQPAGAASQVRFLYKSDGGYNLLGVMLDNVTTTVDGAVLDTDGAESATSPWTGNWAPTTGTLTETSPRYYLMENRSYVAFDKTLAEGPYNFSESFTRPDWVEHFKYQNGLLVWFVNHSQIDNNTSRHPGTGYALPVDAFAEASRWDDGSIARQRIQAFDATFGLEKTDELTLHRQVSDGADGYVEQTLNVPSRQMKATFNDSDPMAYYDEANPQNSVKVAGVGVTATVTKQSATSLKVKVVNPTPKVKTANPKG